jgi:hypothetical protein
MMIIALLLMAGMPDMAVGENAWTPAVPPATDPMVKGYNAPRPKNWWSKRCSVYAYNDGNYALQIRVNMDMAGVWMHCRDFHHWKK